MGEFFGRKVLTASQSPNLPIIIEENKKKVIIISIDTWTQPYLKQAKHDLGHVKSNKTKWGILPWIRAASRLHCDAPRRPLSSLYLACGWRLRFNICGSTVVIHFTYIRDKRGGDGGFGPTFWDFPSGVTLYCFTGSWLQKEIKMFSCNIIGVPKGPHPYITSVRYGPWKH